jgi:hypothetical protein
MMVSTDCTDNLLLPLLFFGAARKAEELLSSLRSLDSKVTRDTGS